LAKIGQKLQDHYYFPQDIEWHLQGKTLYIVQTRPVTTTTNKKQSTRDKGDVKSGAVPILLGTSASPGIGTGQVQMIKKPSEINRVQNGDVLVAVMTSPDFVPAMKRASAIVTDEGGVTSHAAIVSREMGMPAVVGTGDATTKLKEGEIITEESVKYGDAEERGTAARCCRLSGCRWVWQSQCER